MMVRHISHDDWLNRCWEEIAQRSVEAGISVQDARDQAVLVDRIMLELGYRHSENVIDLAAVRAAR